MVYDIRDHGAAVDGTTDDTDAINDAIGAAAPNGTVYLPEGEILIGEGSRKPIRLTEDEGGVTLKGAGPTKTSLLMATGQSDYHVAILVSPTSGVSVSGLLFEGFTLDGQGLEQNYNIANGIEVDDAGGAIQHVEVRNCVVRDWATNGLQLREPGTRIYDSSIVVNGRQQEAMTGRDGHGVAAFIGDNPNGQTLVQGCLLQGNTGAGADNKGGNMTIRGSVIDDCGYGVKLNETTRRQVIENTRISNLRTEPGIYNIPPDEVGGELVLNEVHIENAEWAGIDLPANGKVSGDRIVVERTNLGGNQAAGVMVREEGRELNIGEISIHGTASGTAVYFNNCSGSIDRLVHGNNEQGVGSAGGVSIGSVESGAPLSISVPMVSDVGATAETTQSDSSSDSTTSAEEYGGYHQPESGTVGWHVPLNENFADIEQDIKDLARRLDNLEG